MADDKKKKQKPPKSPKWSTGLLWAGVHWAVAWFVTEETLWRVVATTFGGFLAGWLTAVLLGRFARWGAGTYVMMVLGVVVGVAFASGAVAGLDYLFSLRAVVFGDLDTFTVNWEDFAAFVFSGAVLPAAGLGLFSGVYVRAQIPSGKKK